jgi:predicted nucleic acid-binding protein
VLTDDEAMKKVAEREGIGVLGTTDILRLATQKDFITHSQARQIKADMEAKARFRVKDPDP